MRSKASQGKHLAAQCASETGAFLHLNYLSTAQAILCVLQRIILMLRIQNPELYSTCVAGTKLPVPADPTAASVSAAGSASASTAGAGAGAGDASPVATSISGIVDYRVKTAVAWLSRCS